MIYADLVKEQLEARTRTDFIRTYQKKHCPCIAWAAYHKSGPSTQMQNSGGTSDHLILKEGEFRSHK